MCPLFFIKKFKQYYLNTNNKSKRSKLIYSSDIKYVLFYFIIRIL